MLEEGEKRLTKRYMPSEKPGTANCSIMQSLVLDGAFMYPQILQMSVTPNKRCVQMYFYPFAASELQELLGPGFEQAPCHSCVIKE